MALRATINEAWKWVSDPDKSVDLFRAIRSIVGDDEIASLIVQVAEIGLEGLEPDEKKVSS